ncbi:hypothetical protein [Burkholderia sp. AU45388]|uniref:hypothetical protein n=1 Tax=Burkholderia sp. AU45388 TaxID=3059206 RepID=UPI00264E9A6C|nr:hypothetical protein [Burkholderia sp. AU45388]MDN7427488.1 hypothetical protein [Burkholderia sp. AU45388]
MLLDTIGQLWKTRFNFETGNQWDGRASIPAGTAVGFARGADVFHAAIAVGGTRIRGINGGLLGAGWLRPVDLTRVLQPDPAGSFAHDRTTIRVYLSRLQAIRAANPTLGPSSPDRVPRTSAARGRRPAISAWRRAVQRCYPFDLE